MHVPGEFMQAWAGGRDGPWKNLEHLEEAELINRPMSSSENAAPAADTNNLWGGDWRRIHRGFSPLILLVVCLTAHHCTQRAPRAGWQSAVSRWHGWWAATNAFAPHQLRRNNRKISWRTRSQQLIIRKEPEPAGCHFLEHHQERAIRIWCCQGHYASSVIRTCAGQFSGAEWHPDSRRVSAVFPKGGQGSGWHSPTLSLPRQRSHL